MRLPRASRRLLLVVTSLCVTSLSVASVGGISLAASVELLGATPAAAATVATPAAEAEAAATAAWIRSAQLTDGAIAVWPDTPELRLVWPYLANYAAMGLSRAAEMTGNLSDAAASWRYLDWYASEENSSGYVTDFNVVNGTTPVSTGTMDSTDAYAGTFLTAAWDTYVADPSSSELRVLAPGIKGALKAIESTQMADGLTGAKPDYMVAYLMDDAEVYGGLVSAERMAQALGDGPLTTEATHDATAMYAGWASMWDASTGSFNWAMNPDGVPQATDWQIMYPDGMEQAWAVLFGLASPAQSATIVSHLTAADATWDVPTALVTNRQNGDFLTQPVGWWPLTGLAFAAEGDHALAAQGAAQISAAATAVGDAWPYTTGNAGQLILLLSGSPAVSPARASSSVATTSPLSMSLTASPRVEAPPTAPTPFLLETATTSPVVAASSWASSEASERSQAGQSVVSDRGEGVPSRAAFMGSSGGLTRSPAARTGARGAAPTTSVGGSNQGALGRTALAVQDTPSGALRSHLAAPLVPAVLLAIGLSGLFLGWRRRFQRRRA